MPSTDVPVKSSTRVNGHNMAYVDRGDGEAIVFLHGNPTSSYLWRNIIPYLEPHARCIAPDLIGMGDSDKLADSGPGRYRFVEHREYLDALLDQLDLGDQVTLVLHDWGSALGFDWACRHESRIRGIAYMEAIVRPLGWAEWPDAIKPVFQGLRSDAGEQMILEKNVFVERILPGSILRELEPEEMAEYRRPFAEGGEARRPTLTWPREIPLDGEPEDVSGIVADYAAWMGKNDIPKLFINADPGAILIGPPRDTCRTWRNQTEVTVPGSHFIQEDAPQAIGEAIAAWYRELP